MDKPEISRPTRTVFGPLLIALFCGFAAGPGNGAALTIPVQVFQGGEVVAAGDFNGDGRTDLAVAGHGDTVVRAVDVAVLLGRDDGTFSSGPRIPITDAQPDAYPGAIVVGDFDGDGRQDVAVATASPGSLDGPGSGSVSILLGAGDGTLGPPQRVTVGAVPLSMAMGDFDDDGRPDLAVANNTSNDVSILLGLGGGAFAPQVRFPAGDRGPRSVAVGDFDEDGHQDLAIAGQGSSDVSVLLGRGDGTFGPGALFAVGLAPASVVVGDFNGDAHQDLAVANSFPDANDVSVLLGRGDGTFAAQMRYPAGEQPHAVVLGDFNDDGLQDLALADVGDVSVLLSHGDGTFGSPIPCGACSAVSSLAPGRFNGDGHLDLAAGNQFEATFALLGRGDGTFMTAARYEVGVGPLTLALGDFNGDQRQDLVVASNQEFAQGGGSPACAEDVSILLGRSDGTLAPAPRMTIGKCPNFVAVGDFDNDGRQDLVLANADTRDVSVALGRGDGSFGPEVRFGVGVYPVSVAVADVNNDGRPDLAVANEYDSLSNGVSVLLGRGDGTFAPQVSYEAGARPRAIVVADLDGDGRSDLVVANLFSDTVSVLRGRGDGTFDPQTMFAAGSYPLALGVGDFNADGKEDLAVVNETADISVLLGHGDGTFGAPVGYPIGGLPSFYDLGNPIAVADLNGDGRLDLALSTYGSSVSILLGNGDGTFEPPARFLAGWTPASLIIGDLTGNQKPVIAVANQESQDVWVLASKAAPPLALDVRAVPARGSVTISFRTDTQAGLAAINILAGKKGSLVNVLSLEPKPGDAGASYQVSLARGAFKGARSVVVRTVTDDGRTFDSAAASF
jgi:hypothetical protein